MNRSVQGSLEILLRAFDRTVLKSAVELFQHRIRFPDLADRVVLGLLHATCGLPLSVSTAAPVLIKPVIQWYTAHWQIDVDSVEEIRGTLPTPRRETVMNLAYPAQSLWHVKHLSTLTGFEVACRLKLFEKTCTRNSDFRDELSNAIIPPQVPGLSQHGNATVLNSNQIAYFRSAET